MIISNAGKDNSYFWGVGFFNAFNEILSINTLTFGVHIILFADVYVCEMEWN